MKNKDKEVCFPIPNGGISTEGRMQCSEPAYKTLFLAFSGCLGWYLPRRADPYGMWLSLLTLSFFGHTKNGVCGLGCGYYFRLSSISSY